MNKRLLLLSGIAIIAVLANHASHAGFLAMFWWTDRYLSVTVPNYDQMGSLAYYGLVAQQKLALFSVPAFLLVSGAFIAYAARGSQSRLGWAMIRSRILNLIPPYLIWTSVFILAEILVLSAKYSPGEILLSFVTIRKSPYFFVPLLIVFFVLSPLLAELAKSRWKLLLALAILIQASAITFAYIRLGDIQIPFQQTVSFILSSQVVEYFFFYVLGLIVGFRLTQLKQGLYKYRWILLFSTLIFAVLAVVEAEWIYQSLDKDWRSATVSLPTFLYSTAFIFCFLSFEHVKVPFSEFFYRLGVGTLAIYLIHKSVLLILPKIVYHVAPFILGHQILYQPLLISVAIGIPVLMMEITKRSPLKKYYRTFFG